MDGDTIDLEAEYNNRARVPEHPAIISRWESDASAYRAIADVDIDLSYGPDPRNVLDLFHADRDRKGPIAVFIHGGYWRSFDKNVFSHMAVGLNAHGIPVAVPSYRLCPNVSVIDIIDDLRRCALWLFETVERPLFCVGHSAGGHLAAALLASDWAAAFDPTGARLVRGAASISGLFDLSPMIGLEMNADLKLTAETAQAASPIGWSAPVGTLLHAYVGAEESGEFKRQSQMIVEAWGAAGVHAEYEEVPGTNHFTVVDGLAEPDSEMTENIAHLLHSLE